MTAGRAAGFGRLLAVLAALVAAPAAAQGPDPGAVIAQVHGGDLAGSYWLQGLPDGQGGYAALSVVYKPMPGGNATTIESAAFAVGGDGTVRHLGMIDGLFGLEPREPVFTPETVELTTTMPRDGEPRCCPTGSVRWRIDLRALRVVGRSEVF